MMQFYIPEVEQVEQVIIKICFLVEVVFCGEQRFVFSIWDWFQKELYEYSYTVKYVVISYLFIHLHKRWGIKPHIIFSICGCSHPTLASRAEWKIEMKIR